MSEGLWMQKANELARENAVLRDALVPFACISNVTARRLGLFDEWKIARELTGAHTPLGSER